MTTYAEVAELRSQMNKQSTESDALLSMALEAASEALDNFCNRPDGFVAVTSATARLFAGDGSTVLWIDECVEITLVEVKSSPTDSAYVTWTTDDWLAFSGDPNRPNYNRLPYQAIMVNPTGGYAVIPHGRVPTARITAKWGYAATCPAVIKQACITQAARWFKRGQSAWADSSGSAEMGGTLLYRKALDPDLQMMLVSGRLVRPTIG